MDDPTPSIPSSMSSSGSRPRGQCGRFPIRFLILGMTLMATAIEYICRYNINVSMVAMVKESPHTNTSHLGVCPNALNHTGNGTDTHAHGIYDWDDRTQGLILGSFFWTYTLMQIPAGRLAEVIGGRWLVVGSLLGSGVLNLLTPWLTFSVTVLILSRMTLGFLQSSLFPACFSILYQWFPLQERSMSYAVMEVGTMFGSISAAYLAGFMADHGFAGGWPSTFYISGLMGLVGALIYFPYVTSVPEDNSLISVPELKHIRRDSMSRGRRKNDSCSLTESGDSASSAGGGSISKKKQLKLPVPWLQIITSKAVIANVIAKFCLRWTFYTLVMKLPSYLHDVLGMSTTKNGLVNGSMYLCQMGPLLGCGYLSEKMIQHKWLTRTQTRKLFISVACIGSAACLVLVPVAACDETMVIVILMVSNVFQGLDSAGNIPLPGEISKNFATTVFAIVNMFNTSIGFIVPYVIGAILDAGKEQDQLWVWSLVFYLSAGMAVIGTVVIVAFGSADRQTWDLDPVSGDEVSHLIQDTDSVHQTLLNSPQRRATYNNQVSD